MRNARDSVAGRGDDLWSSLLSVRPLLLLTLAVGLFQIVAYWLCGAFASTDGATPVPQPDTLLYCQAARRICEGHPFSFSAGTAISTGTTSVLYPFVLALPYACGMDGNSLLAAGFLLNAVFYLVFLAGWMLSFRAWLGCGRASLLASLLLAFYGQTAFSAFAQSDIGFWLAVSGVLAWGLASGRFWVVAVALTLGPWARPEGMVCVIAFLLMGVLDVCLRGRLGFSRRDWGVATAAAVSMAGVFALNYALTGQCQFSSVADKGHLANSSFPAAVYLICSDFVTIFKTFFLGLSPNSPRDFFCFPLLGGFLICVGACTLRLRGAALKGLAVFALACLGGLVTVAQSGWQGTNLDRYLAWIAPVSILLLAQGVRTVVRSWMRGTIASWVLTGALLAQVVGCMVGFWAMFARNNGRMEPVRHFMAACEEVMPKGASVGGFSGVGLTYGFTERRFAHLTGIYSPEFRCPNTHEAIEELKHCPDKRFDYWIVDVMHECPFAKGEWRDVLWGRQVLVGPNGFELRKADWTAYDNAVRVPSREGVRLVACLDVGWPADERKADYRVFDRYARHPFEPFIHIGDLQNRKIIEAGRLVFGGDEMTIPLQPGRDVLVVMRTLPRVTAVLTDGITSDTVTGEFGAKMRLNVQIGEKGVPFPVELNCPTNGFADVWFTIPGKAITSSNPRVAFLGDHITCGYWFFQ